ncbi:MAG: hypothetical protein R2867_16725 [Caldilineaceae bacterium]
MLPQVTDLGLSLGAIFEGALITEVCWATLASAAFLLQRNYLC